MNEIAESQLLLWSQLYNQLHSELWNQLNSQLKELRYD